MILRWFQCAHYYWYHFCFYVPCVMYSVVIYFRSFLASFLITFLSPEVTASINVHIPLSSSWIMMSYLLLGMVFSVLTC